MFHARLCRGGVLGPQLLSETDVALFLLAPDGGTKRLSTDIRWRRLSYKHVGLDLYRVFDFEDIDVAEMKRSAAMASVASQSRKWLDCAMAPPKKSAGPKARAQGIRRRRSQVTGSSGFNEQVVLVADEPDIDSDESDPGCVLVADEWHEAEVLDDTVVRRALQGRQKLKRRIWRPGSLKRRKAKAKQKVMK